MPLPVDPERLRKRFPALSDADIEAYVAVTRKVLADPVEKGRVLRRIMDVARAAEEKAASGAALDSEAALALGYVRAVAKMQAPLAPFSRGRPRPRGKIPG